MAKIRYSWYNSLRNEGHFMTKLSQEQLNNLSKEELVAETLKLQDQYIDLSQKVDFLTEQIMLMNQRQFGRKTEKNSVPDGYQVYHSIDKERQDLTVAGCGFIQRGNSPKSTKHLVMVASVRQCLTKLRIAYQRCLLLISPLMVYQ